MKKRLFLLLLSAVMVCSLIGCGKKDKKDDTAQTVAEDVVEFINDELPSIKADRDNAMAIYNAYFTTEDVDMDQYLSDLTNTALPALESYMVNLTAIEVSTDEVKELKNLYLESTQKQYEAMQNVISAISEQNPEYLTTAEQCIVDSNSLLTQFESKLRILAADNNITINGSFSISTSSDAVQ